MGRADEARLAAARCRLLSMSGASAKRVWAALTDADAVCACAATGCARLAGDDDDKGPCDCEWAMESLSFRFGNRDAADGRPESLNVWESEARRSTFCGSVASLREALRRDLPYSFAFVQAAHDGALPAVRFLHANRTTLVCNFDEMRGPRANPLEAAAASGRVACVDALMSNAPRFFHGGDVEDAFIAAARAGSAACMARLVADGIDPCSITFNTFWAAMHDAVIDESGSRVCAIDVVARSTLSEGWRDPAAATDARAKWLGEGGMHVADRRKLLESVEAFCARADALAALPPAKKRKRRETRKRRSAPIFWGSTEGFRF